MSNVAENQKLLAVLKSEKMENLLLILNEQDRILNEMKAKMQPKYDEILKNTKLVLNESGKRREDALYNESGEILEINWDRLYLLEDGVFKNIMIEKNKIDRECGYDVELNYCPILIAKDRRRETIQQMIDLYAQEVNEDFKLIPMKLESYNNFVELMLKTANGLKATLDAQKRINNN